MDGLILTFGGKADTTLIALMKAFHSTSRALYNNMVIEVEEVNLVAAKLKSSKSAKIDKFKSNLIKFLTPSFITVLT